MLRYILLVYNGLLYITASLNSQIPVGVENISFKCGRAESVLPELMNSMRSEEPVAIVDPPRAGLSKDCVSLFIFLFNLSFNIDMLFVNLYLSQPSLSASGFNHGNLI